MDDGGDSMDFTPRMQQILQRLLSEIDFVSEQTLADNLGISKRTVQRELDGTTDALASYGLQLQRKKKAGLMLIGPEEEKERLAASCKRHRLWILAISRIAAVTCSLKSCATGHRRSSSITASSSASVKPQPLQTWKHWHHGCKKIIYPF